MSQAELQASDDHAGVAALVAAATMWGCFPAYWSLLSFTDPLDILNNRIIWSFLVGVVALRVVDGIYLPRPAPAKQLVLLFVAATLLSFNWGVSIYAVQINRVVEGGIGMYFAPVFQMAIGCVLFHEPYNSTKRVVSVLSVTSIALLIYDLGEFPFIAFGMGLSFAFYATTKKLIDVSSRQSFIYETSIMLVPSLIYMHTFGSRLTGGGFENTSEMLLLIGAGLIAAPPLILYGFGAQRTTLTTSGMILNFIPILNIIVGIVLLRETFSPLRAVATVLISVAVFYYTLQRGR
jgi:chloramphenicol-sensitive protein RarD